MTGELDKSKYKDGEEKKRKYGSGIEYTSYGDRRPRGNCCWVQTQIIAGAGTLPSVDRRRLTEYVGDNALYPSWTIPVMQAVVQRGCLHNLHAIMLHRCENRSKIK